MTGKLNKMVTVIKKPNRTTLLAVGLAVVFFGSLAYAFHPAAKPVVVHKPTHHVKQNKPKPAPQAAATPTPAAKPAPAPTPACSLADNDVEALVNDYRVKNGLPKLCVDQRLRSAALEHAKYLCQANRSDHDKYAFYIQQSGYPLTGWYGENLTAGFNSPQAVVNAWINSPEHRDNMLNPHYKDQGISNYVCPLPGYLGNLSPPTNITLEDLGSTTP